MGGHINPIDKRDDHLGKETYMAGVNREIDEELNISGSYTNQIIGILNDDSNTVGKVHLGVVHLIDLDDEEVCANEDAISELTLSPLNRLKGELYDRLETWSSLCIPTLEKF